MQAAFRRTDCPDANPDPAGGETEGEAVQEFLRAHERVVRQLYCYFACTPEANVPTSREVSVMGSSTDETLVPAIVLREDWSLKPGETFSPGSSKVSTKVSASAHRRAGHPSGAFAGSGLSFADFQAFLRAAG